MPHFPPIFPPDIWILTFCAEIGDSQEKKKGEMGMNQNVSHFPPFFHKVCSIMVTKFCLML